MFLVLEADLFTEDGSFGDRVGRAALLEFVRGRKPSTVHHAPLTPMITATAEGARGIVLNLFVDVSQKPAIITIETITYEADSKIGAAEALAEVTVQA